VPRPKAGTRKQRGDEAVCCREYLTPKSEQERNRQLLQAIEDAAKSSEATLEALHLDVEALTSTKDSHAQLLDKVAKLAEAQK
jgi:hypothetical protein